MREIGGRPPARTVWGFPIVVLQRRRRTATPGPGSSSCAQPCHFAWVAGSGLLVPDPEPLQHRFEVARAVGQFIVGHDPLGLHARAAEELQAPPA